MASETDSGQAIDPAISDFVSSLIADAALLRIPDVFALDHPEVIYQTENRHGVSVIVLPTSLLTEDQILALLRYRLAQYLAIGFIDASIVYEARMKHEPRSNISDNDIHVIAGSAESGEILCYAVIEAPPASNPGETLRDRNRALFPVEKIHGWGIYNRLQILPELPLYKLREFGRFVKNQQVHTFDELGARSTVEIGVALFRSLSGPLRLTVDAIIGDFEEGVAKQNLEFFHVPMIVIHGTVPYLEEASYLSPRYQISTVYPFALLSSDISKNMLDRMNAIEEALNQPGKKGLLALFALKRATAEPISSMEPEGGLAALTDTAIEQEGRAMPQRRLILDLAERLRQTDLFSGLSVAEAAVLGTFMERVDVDAGEVVVSQGELSDSLYLIETGQAEVRVSNQTSDDIVVAQLNAGDYFGEIALLTGEPRIADVVAVTPMSLLQLTRDAYTRYLQHAVEVEQSITRTALSRTRETARKMIPGEQ